jgi:hypothetical protein
MLQNSKNGVNAPATEVTRPAEVEPSRVLPPKAMKMSPASESRLNDRFRRSLSQKRTPNVVLVGVLSAALLLGLIGFALHFVWVVAVIVMALGLGYTLANSRRDRIDVVNKRAEDEPAPI